MSIHWIFFGSSVWLFLETYFVMIFMFGYSVLVSTVVQMLIGLYACKKEARITAQKLKFSIKDFFSKCDIY